jgi:Spy/CpxP family protein refolding chaperone
MIRKKWDILLIAALLFVLTALVASGCYPRTPEKRADRVVRHIVRTLKLDDAQTAKLETMKEEFLARRPELLKMREDTLHDLKDLMASPLLDREKLYARTEKIQTEMSDTIRFVSAKLAELHDMLTPEQRGKLAELMEKHTERARHW